MDQRRKEEGREHGGRLGEVERCDRGVVDVPEEEVVDGAVPIARVLVEGGAVPPRGVETPVGEVGQLREEVELILLALTL